MLPLVRYWVHPHTCSLEADYQSTITLVGSTDYFRSLRSNRPQQSLRLTRIGWRRMVALTKIDAGADEDDSHPQYISQTAHPCIPSVDCRVSNDWNSKALNSSLRHDD